MKKLRITLVGKNTLLMHSAKGVNPLDPLTKERNKISSKRSKDMTDEDYQRLSDIDWEQGLYYDDERGLYLPAESIRAMLYDGAKVTRNGSSIIKYVTMISDFASVDIGVKFDYRKMFYDMKYRDVRNVCVNRARVPRTRPRFDVWRCVCDVLVDETMIDMDVIVNALAYAGQYVGIGDGRKLGYGRFDAIIDEVEA